MAQLVKITIELIKESTVIFKGLKYNIKEIIMYSDLEECYMRRSYSK